MVIAIDLRGLNFLPKTGINTYTLHLLYCLADVAKNNNIKIVGIGLKNDRILSLSQEFPFFKNIQHTSIHTYAKYPKWVSSQIISLLEIFRIRKSLSLRDKLRTKFDYLILPQPKVMLANPETKLITCFHDIYNILDTDYLSIKQSFWDNKFNYQILINESCYCLANSISTATDIKTHFANTASKIKLFYLSLPNWNMLREIKYVNISTKYQTKILNNIPAEYVLAISGIEPRKNWHSLIIAHHIASKHASYNGWLVLAGTPVDMHYFNYLKKLVEKYKISNIKWVLKPTEHEKELLLKNCICLVYPSFYEGFGLPILEAFKFGKSVITSKLGSMPEIAQKSGLLVDPNNANEIARAILVMYFDKDFRKSLEIHTKSQLLEFSWEQYRQDLEDLLK